MEDKVTGKYLVIHDCGSGRRYGQLGNIKDADVPDCTVYLSCENKRK